MKKFKNYTEKNLTKFQNFKIQMIKKGGDNK